MSLSKYQRRLNELGFDAGAPDGKDGPRTNAAFEALVRKAFPPVVAPPVEPQPTGQLLPSAWTPPAQVRRIVGHWTGGGYRANPVDTKAYHLLVQGDGSLVKGDFSIAANCVPKLLPGKYAMHTGGLNSYAVGISCCCMLKAVEVPFYAGPYPLLEIQWDTMVNVVAELCRRYGIKVSPDTVLHHAEVRARYGVGVKKWDFTHLAFDPSITGAQAIGDRLRKQVHKLL